MYQHAAYQPGQQGLSGVHSVGLKLLINYQLLPAHLHCSHEAFSLSINNNHINQSNRLYYENTIPINEIKSTYIAKNIRWGVIALNVAMALAFLMIFLLISIKMLDPVNILLNTMLPEKALANFLGFILSSLVICITLAFNSTSIVNAFRYALIIQTHTGTTVTLTTRGRHGSTLKNFGEVLQARVFQSNSGVAQRLAQANNPAMAMPAGNNWATAVSQSSPLLNTAPPMGNPSQPHPTHQSSVNVTPVASTQTSQAQTPQLPPFSA